MIIDNHRLKRQDEALTSWKKNDFKGCIQACTGFGKTFIALRAIHALHKRGRLETVNIIVPTIDLKDQWLEEISNFNIKAKCQVFVINTAAKYYEVLDCDLLIIDEYHTAAAETFRTVLKIKRKMTLALTATIERADNLHKILIKSCPVVDKISLEEALENEWISPYVIFNLGVDLPPEMLEEYNAIDGRFKGSIAKQFRGISDAKNSLNNHDGRGGLAKLYFSLIRKRKTICKENPNKLIVLAELLPKFTSCGFIFAPSKQICDDLSRMSKGVILAYHSGKSDKKNRATLKKFKDGRTKSRFLATVEKINAGLNHPKSSLGIIISGDSSKLKNIQRIGRLIRKIPGKKAVIINLYSKNTQEVYWLENRLGDQYKKSYFVSSVEELLQKLKELNEQ